MDQAELKSLEGVDVDALVAENSALLARIAELEALVDSDTVTAVSNRRGFEKRLSFEIRQVERHKVVSTLVFIDINGMKQINDQHGHLAGDAALRHVADHLIRSFRATDLIARIGGDEFALVLDHAGEEDISQRMDRLAHELAADPVDWLGSMLPLSLSWGLTLIHDGDSIETAIDRADSAMYEAKQASRS